MLVASGKDRPGIVSAVTQILFEDGCNIEEAKATVLGSEFALLALVAAPSALSMKALDASLGRLRRKLAIDAKVRPVAPAEAAAARPGAAGRWHVMVRGKDRPGIVYQLSTLLSSLGVNILDAATKLDLHPGSPPIVNLFLDVSLPPKLGAPELKAKLKQYGETLGLSFQLEKAAHA